MEGRVQKELTDEQTFILESLYAGPGKGDAAENAAEATVQQLTQRGRQVQQALEHHKEAHRLLESAGTGVTGACLSTHFELTAMDPAHCPDDGQGSRLGGLCVQGRGAEHLNFDSELSYDEPGARKRLNVGPTQCKVET